MGKISSFTYEFIGVHVPKENILLNEPMDKHTTFRIGGKARCFVKISNAGQLSKLVPGLKERGVPYFVLGNGSNLLVGDLGYEGVILQIGSGMNGMALENSNIRAQAGALLSQVAKYAQQKGLAGLEFASGIPGTIGGGIVMNAGAYGGEMKQVVAQVTVMDEKGQVITLEGDSMEFGYRTSIIKSRPLIVLEVLLRLRPGDPEKIQAKMEELAQQRKAKQPLEFASAGSTFKRPQGYFAGKLIMDAGLKGYSVGDARVSEKHCGFVVNTGRASAADVMEVIQKVQKKVKEDTGVSLEPEVILLGDF